jgi:hypothetical protein
MCTVFVVPCALCVARIEVLLPSIANDGQDRQHIVTDINGTYRGKEFVRLCYFITQQKGTFTATFFRLALVFVFGILQVPVSKSYCPRSQMMDRIGNTLPRTSTVRTGARNSSGCAIFSLNRKARSLQYFSSCFGVCLWYSAGASIEVLLPSIANDGQDRQHITTDTSTVRTGARNSSGCAIFSLSRKACSLQHFFVLFWCLSLVFCRCQYQSLIALDRK